MAFKQTKVQIHLRRKLQKITEKPVEKVVSAID